MTARWVSELVIDGEPVFRIGRDGSDLVAEWLGLAELRSDRRGERPSFVAREGADPRVIAKVRAGLGAALVRHLRGGTSLHASAVSRGGRALACLGASGAGKSTVAAWLCRERGFSLLADDVVSIETDERGVMAFPTEVEHWLEAPSRAAVGLALADDSAPERKEPVAAARVAREPAPLGALVSLALGPPEHTKQAPSITRLRGLRAIESLLPCLVRFVLDESQEHIAELGRIDALLERVPFFELRAPREFGALPAIADALEAL